MEVLILSDSKSRHIRQETLQCAARISLVCDVACGWQVPRAWSASARHPDSHQTLVLNGMPSPSGSSMVSPGTSSSGNSSNTSARSQERIDKRIKVQPGKQAEGKKRKSGKIRVAGKETMATAAEDDKAVAEIARQLEKIAELQQTVLEGCLERARLQRTISQMAASSAAEPSSVDLAARDAYEGLTIQPSLPNQQFAESQPRASQDSPLLSGGMASAGRDIVAQQGEVESGKLASASSEMLAADRQERRSIEDCWMRASRQGLGGRGQLRRLSSRTSFGSKKQ